MSKKATRKELRGIRTWSTAIHMWRDDAAETLADHGLTWSGFRVLLALTEGPRRSGELRNEVGMTTGGMAKLLKRLESEGLVRRTAGSDTDGRAVTVELTPDGRSTVAKAAGDMIAMREAEYRRWDIDEDLRDAVDEAWRRIQHHWLESDRRS